MCFHFSWVYTHKKNGWEFYLLREYQNAFQSSYSILHSYQYVGGFQFLPILANTCYFLTIWLNCPSGCEVVSHCGFELHFPDGYDVEHLFMGLLATCRSLEKCLSRSFARFSIGLSFYCSIANILYLILDTSILSDVWFENIFSHSVGCVFTLLIILIHKQ